MNTFFMFCFIMIGVCILNRQDYELDLYLGVFSILLGVYYMIKLIKQ